MYICIKKGLQYSHQKKAILARVKVITAKVSHGELFRKLITQQIFGNQSEANLLKSSTSG